MTDKLYDIIARTSIELGHKTDGKTMAALTKIFANDVATDKRLKRLSLEDIDTAFKLGVRYDEKDCYLNIRTFYRWCFQHKARIDSAIYEVETLNKDPKTVPYYKQKLLK
jgi:hypothetical protein|tara:strand:+ start:436 stop:765 length:330 start_codon:yes stop_codon:yes gene_type:complete